jgi:UDPglucose--hexose-1-phosphate uridylyltransferase
MKPGETPRNVHKRVLQKPDGRALVLFGREPIDPSITAPAPDGGGGPAPNPHLRFHPLRGEWVVYAGHRQHRTFLPPPEYNPLAPTTDPASPTEMPSGRYDVAVFENRFPTLHKGSHDPPPIIVPTAPAPGACEVVVYTQDPKASLGSLPLWHVELVLEAWIDRTAELGRRDDVAYVMPFENRGVEVGVTLHHPHGQIYAYPFVPPIAARELALQKEHFDKTGRGLLEEHLARERDEGSRLVYQGEHALGLIPVFARYAYEVWVAPLRAAATLCDLRPEERKDLARALKTVLLRLDGLWQRPMPYILSIHQAPTDGRPHPEAHVHIEIYPALRMKDRLKYLAGSEIGAGVFTADTLPEEKARELRAVDVSFEGATP